MTREELKRLLTNSRNEKKLTQEQVAVLASYDDKQITRQYYGMIENGDRRPSVDVAKSIAKVLGINWTVFFEVKGNQSLRYETSEKVI